MQRAKEVRQVEYDLPVVQALDLGWHMEIVSITPAEIDGEHR